MSGEPLRLDFSLNYIDYESYPPTPLDQTWCDLDIARTVFPSVPIIRIFGRTDVGQNVCALIHGVFPYMYVQYDGKLDSMSIQANSLSLMQNINLSLATAFRRNPHEDTSLYVADVQICRATPFYGMQVGWSYYYKISLLNPRNMTRLSDLFRQGAILGRPFQPYEAHLPYLLQFMIDYNLYGCGMVKCKNTKLRGPLPESPEGAVEAGILSSLPPGLLGSEISIDGKELLHEANVPAFYVLDPLNFPRRSISSVEIDVLASDLSNRDVLVQRAIHGDLEADANDSSGATDRLLPSLTELWKDDAARRMRMGMEPHKTQRAPPSARTRSENWNNEADMRQTLKLALEKRIERDRDSRKRTSIRSDTLFIPTSFESVEVSCQKHLSHVLLFLKKHLNTDVEMTRTCSVKRRRVSSHSVIQQAYHDQDTRKSRRISEETINPSVNATQSDLKKCITISKAAMSLFDKTLRLRGGVSSFYDDDILDAGSSIHSRRIYYATNAPSQLSMSNDVSHTTKTHYHEPFYSVDSDVQTLPTAPIGVTMPKSLAPRSLQKFFPTQADASPRLVGRVKSIWRYSKYPPSRTDLHDSPIATRRHRIYAKVPSQISGPTQITRNRIKQKKLSETEVPMSALSIEIHAQAPKDLLPNPLTDPVLVVFWSFKDFGLDTDMKSGYIVAKDELPDYEQIQSWPGFVIEIVDSELDLLNALVDLVQGFDPDVIMSYEIQSNSIGYIQERAVTKFGFDLCLELSRIRNMDTTYDKPKQEDRWGSTHATSVKIAGRHVLNLWRVMRGEMNLLQYTVENVCFHLLHRRIPRYSPGDLHRWLHGKSVSARQRALSYYLGRTKLNIEIIEAHGLLSRVSEQARLLGIDFYSVFSRGSQFKVESLMFRIAKPECFMMISPSRKQVAQQNALECLPLVMEPHSRFYQDPVIVLDFQSLYPSIMIAYNYCYSTCLGKIGYKDLETKLGISSFEAETDLLISLGDNVEIAPNGVIFAKQSTRKSLLAKMLNDILETRVMVKEGMNLCRDDKATYNLMHNRQLALKLIANVTYGYTSASFSGRMPCADIADSIVQTGREALEKAIEYIHSRNDWDAEVVYGDTDSLFVQLKGRSKEEAFHIGADMAREISSHNPSPMKLKFEKVYRPCVLLAKKRYVGCKYERSTDIEPVFDAKGIETVRRDGTPAEQKIEERILKILFRTADLSQVKEYFQQECWKIMTGKLSLHDFCFAKEVKLGTYSDKGVPPPGAVISAKNIARDSRAEPQYGERVLYLVISGAARSRLTDRCVPPEDLLLNPDLRLDVEYYITKNLIPPLDRILSLLGVNIRGWYDEMPRSFKLINNYAGILTTKSKGMMDAFITSTHCPICRAEQAKPGICSQCQARPDSTHYVLQQERRFRQRAHTQLIKVCSSCANIPVGIEMCCISRDCPVYYKRITAGMMAALSIDCISELL